MHQETLLSGKAASRFACRSTPQPCRRDVPATLSLALAANPRKAGSRGSLLGHSRMPRCWERVLIALRARYYGVTRVLRRCCSGVPPVYLRYISSVSLLRPRRGFGSPAASPPSSGRGALFL